jgi:hypothetical protein
MGSSSYTILSASIREKMVQKGIYSPTRSSQLRIQRTGKSIVDRDDGLVKRAAAPVLRWLRNSGGERSKARRLAVR